MNNMSNSLLQPELVELEKSGCVKTVIFNWDLQYVDADRIESIIDIAELHGLGMAKGFNGYLEVWLDDDGSFRCQTTDFSSVKTKRGTEGITVTNESSLQIGTKQEAKGWLKDYWAKLNDLSNS